MRLFKESGEGLVDLQLLVTLTLVTVIAAIVLAAASRQGLV